MKEFIFILFTPLVSGGIFSLNFYRGCDHHPPQFQPTLSEGLGSIGRIVTGFIKKCAYNRLSEISDYVSFHLMKRGNDDYEKLTDEQMTKQLNQSLSTYIIFHGFTDGVAETGERYTRHLYSLYSVEPQELSGVNSFSIPDWMKATGRKILENIDANVILVDYRPVSYCNYMFLAETFIFDLAKYTAYCINKQWKLPLTRTKIIGHSIGAHTAGLTGTFLNGRVDEIVALDPAGPCFDGQIFGIRQKTLNSSCAQFVQVLHTKPKYLGTHEHLGDSDFFANSVSSQQPGCSTFDSSCSHARAYELYFASLFPENEFIGYANGSSRNGSVSSRFGFFNDRTSGLFYFDTSACFGYTLD